METYTYMFGWRQEVGEKESGAETERVTEILKNFTM